jgi:hypothetical protein
MTIKIPIRTSHKVIVVSCAETKVNPEGRISRDSTGALVENSLTGSYNLFHL